MKLIFCLACQDVVRLEIENEKFCKCGQSSGKYEEDGHCAWYSGKAVPIGMGNKKFAEAIVSKGKNFDAWVFDPAYKKFVRKQ